MLKDDDVEICHLEEDQLSELESIVESGDMVKFIHALHNFDLISEENVDTIENIYISWRMECTRDEIKQGYRKYIPHFRELEISTNLY